VWRIIWFSWLCALALGLHARHAVLEGLPALNGFASTNADGIFLLRR
jgi:hypothetical protein